MYDAFDFPDQQIITFQEYQCFQVLSNIMTEYSGIYLTSINRHICCGTFIFFGIVATFECMSKVEGYQIVAMVGFMLFSGGFVITFQESRVTQKMHVASSSRIQHF